VGKGTVKAAELTQEEQALLARIDFEPSRTTYDAEAARANGEAALALTTSLVQRKAIPELRLKWFTDPVHNIGGHGSSRQQVFESNGTRGQDILRHPHFLKYLRYFIYGPNLPAAVVEAFEKKVADCDPVTSGDILPLGNLAKQQAHSHGLDPGRAAEEFYKLALECGLDAGEARSIRDAVKTIR
jgi:hypothetical protein